MRVEFGIYIVGFQAKKKSDPVGLGRFPLVIFLALQREHALPDRRRNLRGLQEDSARVRGAYIIAFGWVKKSANLRQFQFSAQNLAEIDLHAANGLWEVETQVRSALKACSAALTASRSAGSGTPANNSRSRERSARSASETGPTTASTSVAK